MVNVNRLRGNADRVASRWTRTRAHRAAAVGRSAGARDEDLDCQVAQNWVANLVLGPQTYIHDALSRRRPVRDQLEEVAKVTLNELIDKLTRLRDQFGPLAGTWPVIASNGEWSVNAVGVDLAEYSSGTFIEIELVDD